ncbi:MAG: uracil-DNA glycosylase [Candidatus Glassbacteria bacterium]
MSAKDELWGLAAQFLRQLEESGEEFVFRHDAPLRYAEPVEAGTLESTSEAGKGESLEEFGGRISGCTRCRLHKSRTNFVFGSGDPEADLMFVGEGPGAEEDRQGLPFVGASGQLLTRIIASIGFSRGEVYIANMVKCRPPGNRDPEPDEIETCYPYLLTQLEMIRPRVVVTLGRHSAQFFHRAPGAPMKSLRQVVGDYDGITVVSTYHPAALLRNPQWKKSCWEDMLLARRVYDQQGGRPSSGEVYQPGKK